MITFSKRGLSTYRILNDDIEIGYITLRESKYSFCIDSISLDSKYRNKGFGREVINLLKTQHKVIVGESSPLAYKFWEKMGAELEFTVTDSDVNRLMDEGVYVPFTIASA